MSRNKLRIMLVDDHAIVRTGFRRLLERYPTMEVVAEAETGERAYQLFIEQAPDITVLDLSMPDVSGLEILRRLLAREPSGKVIIFSMHEDAALVDRAMRLGACGFVGKSAAPDVLARAILDVANGKQVLSPEIADALALHRRVGTEDPLKNLNAREFEIYRRIVKGESAAEIAEALNLSAKTIANYRTSIKQKLNAGSDVDLVRIAARSNLLST